MINTAGSTLRMRALVVALCLSVGLIAIFLGLLGAVSNWYIQVLVISVAVPGVLLLVDYRFGLAFIILFLPYANSPLLPKVGPVSMVNVLILGVCFSFLVRWLMYRLGGRRIEVPIPRELILFYFVPFTLAMMIGSTHLNEIPSHLYGAKLPTEGGYGFYDYWISFYFKTMLLVAAVFALGASVIEGKKSNHYVWLVVVSGCLYSAGIFAVVALSGYSLDQLRYIRDSLRPLGHHNNGVGYMLIWPLAAALFMREFVDVAFKRYLLLAAAGLIFCGILMTFSRGGFVAAMTVVGYYVWHFRRLRTALLVVSFAVVAVVFSPDAVRDRLLTGLEDKSVYDQVASRSGSGDELTAGRVFVWRNLAPEILRSPLFGRGVDSGMWSEFVKNGNTYANPHNMYLSILLDMGIIGAICMVVAFRFVWSIFRKLSVDVRLPPSVQGYFAGATAGLVGMLAGAMTGLSYYPLNIQLYLWIAIGLGLGYRRRLQLDFPEKVEPSANPRFRQGQPTGKTHGIERFPK